MNYEVLNNRLRDIEIENNIWIIYLVIIFLSFLANKLEKEFFLYKNLQAREEYQNIMIIIFIILLIIYIYFFINAYNAFKKINPFDNSKKKQLIYLSVMASFFLVISGLIYLYIAIFDDNIDVELAFN